MKKEDTWWTKLAVLVISILLGVALTACVDDEGVASRLGNPSQVANVTPASYPDTIDPYEGSGDDSLATAGSLSIGQTQNRTVFPQGDNDWVAVNLTSGVTYEFSANNLCTMCDTYMHFYDSAGTEITVGIGSNQDDHVDYDSQITYTPSVTDVFYIKMRGYDDIVGIATYTLSMRVFSDGDTDGFSPFYDCDDADPTINPWGNEIADDGIDQNCDGVDRLGPLTVDSFEVDNTVGAAVPMVVLGGAQWEYQFRGATIGGNARTIHVGLEADWLKFTVPAFGWFNLDSYYNSTTTLFSVFEADGVTPVVAGTCCLDIINNAASTKSYTLKIEANVPGSTLSVEPFLLSYGTDKDSDTWYTRDYDSSRDCNDDDPAIFPGAAETPADGIDSNCNGDDNT